jgi:hypothetical protein
MKLHLPISVAILGGMDELEDAWSQMLAGAIANARSSGRGDVAEYLQLKLTNDLIRQTSVDWLFNSLIELASEENRRNPMIVIEREEPHEFAFSGARMAGELIRVRLGVRFMTLEAGWTRRPEHGFMRGGALAAARITHFGIPAETTELSLIRTDDAPVWNNSNGDAFGTEHIRYHIQVLRGD